MREVLCLLLFFSCVTHGREVQRQVVPWRVGLAQGLIEGAFAIKPLYNLAAKGARTKIIAQADAIGVKWEERTNNYARNAATLETLKDKLTDNMVLYPSYFLREFHAYKEGNMGWQCAYEVESAAQSVHAAIYTPSRDVLEADGDAKLRAGFHRCMLEAFQKCQFKPKKVLDVGCSTGLSTLALASTFPDAEVVGLDLSPYFLSVAQFDTQNDHTDKRISYVHGLAEATPLQEGDVDLYTASLVSHELPASATRAMIVEAFRVLPSGGAVAIMDMDPNSAAFQKVASNPFAFTAFKSTEPWLQEYMQVDLLGELHNAGFIDVIIQNNSPRHRTCTAFKP
jgi:ubiquinone/menaquinone biosynthesis C-methylase UbiE